MPGLNAQNDHKSPVVCEQDCLTLLARDPHWLYVYWEISDDRRKLLLDEFGMDFMERSIPVLKITNITKNDYFYVRINEFSNSWYLNVPDSNSIYVVEIGRKISDNFFISILNSNSTITPNDSLSYDTTACFVNYTDLRDGKLSLEDAKKYDFKEFTYKVPNLNTTGSQEFSKFSNTESKFGESSSTFQLSQWKG
jgi:Uncharacterized protein conserved in bacteria